MIAPTSFFADYGCHVRILEEARVLQKLGHQVTIVTYYKGRDLPDLRILRTRPVPWRAEYEVGSSRHKIAFDLLLSWKALTVVLRERFDLIHAHLHEGALIGGVLSRLRRLPLVFDFQGSLTGEMVDHNFLNPHGPWYRPARWLERRIDHLPDAILTSSHHAAGLLVRDFGVPPYRIQPLPDAVNLGFFRPGGGRSPAEIAAHRARLGIPPDRPVVGYLGLLAEYQGTGKLLEAAAELRRRGAKAHFLIMGYPAVELYRQRARAMGLGGWVTFTGKVPYEQAPAHLALADIAVAPKLSATEGSGKILNYMAMGLPTVAFDTPVSREYLGSLGVYAEAGNPIALADAIAGLLQDREGAVRLGERLRQRAAEQFSWDQAGRRIVAIYDALLRPAAGRQAALAALKQEEVG
ncbi:MAG: glycosyltransferase family 1 protein [Chloroflexi bacterium]|nr:MAG: glycosyltransferase family 1 protein [Chloroflexota bacterium]